MADSPNMKIFGMVFSFEEFQDMDSRKFMRIINMLVAELIGTFLFVFVGCGALVGSTALGIKIDHLTICAAFAMGVGTAIMITGGISGAFLNPSVGLAAVVCGRMSIYMWILYSIFEIIGAIIAEVFVVLMSPGPIDADSAEKAATFCCTVPNKGITAIQATMAELLGTSILIMAVCAVWDFRAETKTESVPLKFVMVILTIAIPIGLYSGGSLNPARSLGPAIIVGFWQDHWVYWVGPLLGALIAALIYAALFRASYTLPEEKQVATNHEKIWDEIGEQPNQLKNQNRA